MTRSQLRVLRFLKRHEQRHVYPPTYRAIMRAAGWTSPNASYTCIRILAEMGLVAFTPGHQRSVYLTKRGREGLAG